MKNQTTPKPGTAGYNPESPKDLNMPKYHSISDRRDSKELPGTENLNDQVNEEQDQPLPKSPKTNLGNNKNKDPESEKLISP